MKNTKIEWCDHTVNFWWGCTEVSEACQNCYARAIARRFKVDCWGDDKLRHFRFEKAIEEVRKLNASAKRRHVVEMVFVNSMSDFFDPTVSDKIRRPLWWLFAECDNLCFMILTKRANALADNIESICGCIPPNVHFGITAENQARFEERMSALDGLDVRVFLSCEPLLGEIDISAYAAKIDWIIVGGEKCREKEMARPTYDYDVWDLFKQCNHLSIPFFFKQHGSNWRGCFLDPEEYEVKEYPAWHSKGGAK